MTRAVLAIVLAFLIGCLVGFLPNRGALNLCRQDLMRAVARGVTAEAALNLCKGDRQ